MVITNIWLGGLALLVVLACTIGLSIALRRFAPRGGFFSDSDRAAGIFSSIGTLFSVLLALVILLSVETYSDTKSHANAEADLVLEQFQLAQLFPSNDQFAVQSQLICYGRSVMNDEWALMSKNRQSNVVDGWAQSIDSTIDSVSIDGAKAESSFELFLQQTLQRQEERRGRLQGAEGSLPPLVWPVLLLGGLTVLAYIISYADRAERVYIQAMQVGLVTVLLGASLLLINALDHPFSNNPGKIHPEKMALSVSLMERDLSVHIDAPNLGATVPCDDAGYLKPDDPQVRSFPAGSTMQQVVARGKIVIGVSFAIPLFSQLDPVSGRMSGFDVDIAREIAYELGLKESQIEWVDLPVEERFNALRDRRVDMVVEAVTITTARKQLVEFSRPYFLAGQSLLVDKNNRTISNLTHLRGRQVCVVPNTTNEQTLLDIAPEAQLVHRPDFPSCVTALKQGQASAVSTDDVILAGLASADPDLVLVGGQFTREPYGVAVPKGDRDFVQFIDSVINRMIDDGRWGKLYYQYLGDIPGLAPVKDAKTRLPFGVDD
jgi:polar amino acid transport system substrate-binding protein